MARYKSQTEKVLNVWAVILIIWSLYRATFKVSLDPLFDEFIAKPLVFLIPVYLFITHVEKKPFFKTVGLVKKNWGRELFYGLIVGGIFFAGAVVATGIKIQPSFFTEQKFLIAVATAFAAAITEEILSRGFVLRELYDESKNAFTSSFLASVLFFFLHIPILFTTQNMTGALLLRVMITDIIFSLAVSFVYIARDKNLIMPIMIHALYALSLFLFFM